ncbi:hypothetical protein BKA70DRAFT_1560232 [Coprinopsis sp. MPI-PUGE-AT-0042]|nr:hypothetical protein BKA70DRAFT_1560232 [Coprinopsis sp. MPI-PUGE-AT-0042]
MMARLSTVLVAVFLLFCNACVTFAAPLAERQLLGGLGGIGCNVARVQTVAGLSRTIGEVNRLSSAAGADAATADAAATAGAALDSAQAGIREIAVALFTGEAPPQSGRDAVEAGLTDAKAALDSITSTDPAITAQVAEAQKDLASTAEAGQKVVSRC